MRSILDCARNDRAPKLIESQLNRPFKYKFSGPRERDVPEVSVNCFETNPKFVPAARNYSDGATRIFNRSKDERACHYSRAARECFVFHTTFIGANGDLVGSAFFDEV